MVNQELTNYIQQSLTAGVKKEDIINTLLNIGWQKIDIDEAFRQLESTSLLYRFQPHIPEAMVQVRVKKKRVALKFFLTVLIIGLIAGGSWSYYFFIQRPQLALRQMPNRMAEIEILKYEFTPAPTRPLSGIYKRDSKEYLNKIIEKFKSHKRDLAKIKSLAKRKVLNNIPVYHYNLSLDNEAAEWLAQAVYETELGKNYEEFSQQERENLDKIIKNIRKSAPKVRKIDAYVGQNDLYLYKLDVVFDNKNLSLKLSDFDNIRGKGLGQKSIREIYNDILINLIPLI